MYSQELVDVQKFVYFRPRLREALQIQQDPSRVRFACKSFLELFTAVGRFYGKGGESGLIEAGRAQVDLREYY